MEKDLEALEQQVASLEEDHGIRGTFNPETTKVLEFRDSPDRVEHAIRTSTLERLREENHALMARIAELEGRAGAAEGRVELGPRASLVTLQADLAAAKAAVMQKETMLKRISQVSCRSSVSFTSTHGFSHLTGRRREDRGYAHGDR